MEGHSTRAIDRATMRLGVLVQKKPDNRIGLRLSAAAGNVYWGDSHPCHAWETVAEAERESIPEVLTSLFPSVLDRSALRRTVVGQDFVKYQVSS
jgi:hypothetical protein